MGAQDLKETIESEDFTEEAIPILTLKALVIIADGIEWMQNLSNDLLRLADTLEHLEYKGIGIHQ